MLVQKGAERNDRGNTFYLTIASQDTPRQCALFYHFAGF